MEAIHSSRQIIVRHQVYGPTGPLAVRQLKEDTESQQVLHIKIEVERGKQRWQRAYGDQESKADGNVFKSSLLSATKYDDEHDTPLVDPGHLDEIGQIRTLITLPRIEDWSPVGDGKQPLYAVRLTLLGKHGDAMVGLYRSRVLGICQRLWH